MDPNDAQLLRTLAKMDGLRAIARDSAKRVEVSQMELILLCTWAHLGVMYHLAETVVPGAKASEARAQIAERLEAVDVQFGPDGVNRTLSAAAALTIEGRLAGYAGNAPDDDVDDDGEDEPEQPENL